MARSPLDTWKPNENGSGFTEEEGEFDVALQLFKMSGGKRIVERKGLHIFIPSGKVYQRIEN